MKKECKFLLNWDEVYSDHTPVLCAITDNLKALSWNIMTKCRDSLHKLNNGFNKYEDFENGVEYDKQEYSNRLSRIANFLGNVTRSSHNLSVIALQEVPMSETHRQHFYQALKNSLEGNWEISDQYYNPICSIRKDNTYAGSFGNLLLINKEIFDDAENMTANIELDTRQKGRLQLVKLKGSTQDKIIFVNVHLYYKYDKCELMKQLFNLPQKNERVIVAGDFNTDLKQLSQLLSGHELIKGFYIGTEGSLFWDKEACMPLSSPKLIDGFFSNYILPDSQPIPLITNNFLSSFNR